MICPYCGKENPEDLTRCGYCGGPLVVVEEPIPEQNPLEPKVTIIDTPPEPEILPPPPPEIKPQAPRGIYGNRIWWLIGCVVLVIIFLCCGITLLVLNRAINSFGASPVATLVPALVQNINPTPLPPSTQDVIFFDDFSDPASGWDSVDNSNYYSDYYENSYRMMVYTDMSDIWANPGSNTFGDVSIEVEATKNGGPDDNDFGVICRYQNSDEFYYGVISSDGYYGILKVTSDSTDQLGYSELQPSSVINQGSSTNHIRFDCIGNVMTLYVNGQQVDQQTDSTYTTGNAGLIAGTYDTPGTDILFDNFSVLNPLGE